jgi:hypothetical protein
LKQQPRGIAEVEERFAVLIDELKEMPRILEPGGALTAQATGVKATMLTLKQGLAGGPFSACTGHFGYYN